MLRRAAKNVMRRDMRLTCPSCQTEYDVPDEAVAGRTRTLRCACCGQQWRREAMPAAPADVVPAAPADAMPAAPADVVAVAPADAVAVAPAGEVLAGPAGVVALAPADEVAAPADGAREDEPLIDAPPLFPEREVPAGRAAAEESTRRGRLTPVTPAAPVAKRRVWVPGVVVLVVVVVIAAVLAVHRPVMRAWPASVGFYQALGLK